MKNLLKSFMYAFNGIICCVRSERNFRIHMTAAAVAFVFAWIYGVSKTQTAVLILTCAAVFSFEAVNTAIEAAVDLNSFEKSQLAKIAKDAAAGAVLISAVGAVAIAVCIFSDTARLGGVLLKLISMPYLIFTALFVMVSIWFIFGFKNTK